MTVQHTSGKWWILDNGSEDELAIVARRTDPFRDVAYLKRETDQDFADVQANAQLIVAAPEMLAVLETVYVDLVDYSKRLSDVYSTGSIALASCADQVHAVIQKAKGGA